MVTETDIIAIPPYVPDFLPVPQVTPFTFRDGQAYLERIERLVKWVNNYLLPLLNQQMNDLGNEFTDDINNLITEVNDAVTQVINSAIVLQDAVMTGIVNDDASTTRVALDVLYASVTNLTAVSARVTTLETLTNSGRLAPENVVPPTIVGRDNVSAPRDNAYRFFDAQLADLTVSPQIAIRGHSVVAGAQASDVNHRFTTLVANALGAYRPGSGTSVYGQSGWTTTQMLTDPAGPAYPLPIAGKPTSLVIIMAMLNDYSANIPSATTKTNLEGIISAYRAAEGNSNLGFLIIGEWLRTDTSGSEPWINYLNVAREISNEDSNVAFLDLSQRLPLTTGDPLAFYNADHVHPNDRGHAVIAKLILGEILRGHYLAPSSNAIGPWQSHVDMLSPDIAHTGVWSIVATGSTLGWANESDGAQNDDITFNVYLPAGTWSMDMYHRAGLDRGIYSIYLDGALQGATVDGYAAAATDARTRRASWTFTAAGIHTFRLVAATKNASSTGYKMSLNKMIFARTA